jgi:DNA-binding CsgD family transcriptional regulator
MTNVSSIYTKARAERVIRDFHHQIKDCNTVSEVKPALSRVIRKAVGASGVVFFPFYWGITPESEVVLHSEYLDLKKVSTKIIAVLPMVNKELGFISSYQKEKVHTRNVMDYYGRQFLQKTWFYNDVFRPFKTEHVISAFMETKRKSIIGYMQVTRSDKEPSFSDLDLKLTESIRLATETTLGRIAQSDEDVFAPAEILTALANSLPHRCAVLDQKGRLIWVNRTAEKMLDEQLLSLSGKYCLCSKSPIVEHWKHAIQQASYPAVSAVNISNGLTVNRIERLSGNPLYLIIDTVAETAPNRSWKVLSSRENEIAGFAAQGYSPLNIGAMLSISTGTVRLHLKSIYRKLRVSSRVELALKMNF